MMGSNVWDRVEQKLQCYEAIRRAEVDDEKRYLLIDTVDNYLELSENDEERFAAQMRQEEHEEIGEMIRTYSEALAEHEARSEARGMALGEARGKLEATREAILLFAKSRYDSLPTNFESRLRTIEDLDRLHEVLERISETGRTELL